MGLSELDVDPGHAGSGLGDGERVVDEVVGSGSAREVDCVSSSAARVFLKNMMIGNCRCCLLSCSNISWYGFKTSVTPRVILRLRSTEGS
jgi:hypothetical protein